jgi:putative ABC transport system permease protein
VVLFEAIRQALRTLRSHKMHALLTLFGFVWGTAAVIFLMGWGDGLTVMLERGFAKTGRNMGILYAGKIGENFTPAADRRYLWFTTEDIEVSRRRAKLAEVVAGESQKFGVGAFRQTTLSVDIRGVEPETLEIRGVPLAAGRGIRRTDLEHRRRVAVLGDRLRRKLLGARGGLGSWIRVNGIPFEVVGILQHVGIQLSRDGLEIDDQVWLPLTTYQVTWPEWWTDDPVVRKVLYRVPDRHLFEATRDELRALLSDRLGVPSSDDEAVGGWSPLEMLNKIPLDEVRGLMFLIAVTTLVIGGVGILNMMLDAVHERRQEIGIRLALGARRRDVLLQFFLETFVITSIGGAVGVFLGVSSCSALASFEVPDVVPVPILSPSIIVIAIGVMTFVGFVSGLLPAWRATRVDPAETLRME